MTDYLKITFIQSSPFSLRVSESTAKMGKTHLCPTPHCIKSTLIDRYSEGKTESEVIAFLKIIDTLTMIFELPNKIVVNQSFYTKLKPARTDAKSDDAFTSTIMYQEYVQYPEFSIFIDVTHLSKDQRQILITTFNKINYLGKKDSLVSYKDYQIISELPKKVVKPLSISDPIGMIISMDDFCHTRKPNSEKEFLSDLRLTGGYGKYKERSFIDYVFPYRIRNGGRKYTMYQLI